MLYLADIQFEKALLLEAWKRTVFQHREMEPLHAYAALVEESQVDEMTAELQSREIVVRVRERLAKTA